MIKKKNSTSDPADNVITLNPIKPNAKKQSGDQIPIFKLGNSPHVFHGRPPIIGSPYIACLGSSFTYGKDYTNSWPAALSRLVSQDAVNLGVIGAGPEYVLKDPALLEAARSAEYCAIEIMGAINLSNRYYTVDNVMNSELTSVSDTFRILFPEVSVENFRTPRRLIIECLRKHPENIHLLIEELKAAWTARMRHLLRTVNGQAFLLWTSPRRPESPHEFTADDQNLADFVTLEMMQSIQEEAIDIVYPDFDLLSGHENADEILRVEVPVALSRIMLRKF